MSAIKKGDLVMVVRGHPCGLGNTFKVVGVRPATPFIRCCDCKERMPSGGALAAVREDGRVFVLSRLIKIDPPALDKSTEQERELCHY